MLNLQHWNYLGIDRNFDFGYFDFMSEIASLTSLSDNVVWEITIGDSEEIVGIIGFLAYKYGQLHLIIQGLQSNDSEENKDTSSRNTIDNNRLDSLGPSESLLYLLTEFTSSIVRVYG